MLQTTKVLFLFFSGLIVLGSGWLFGARAVWAQQTLLLLASCCLITGLALFFHQDREIRLSIFRWKGLWISAGAAAGFLAILFVQSWNEGYIPEVSGNFAAVYEKEHIEWLPRSISSAFDGKLHEVIAIQNPERYLLIYGTVAIGALGLLLGSQAPGVLKPLTQIILLQALVTSLLCIVHQISGSTKVLWLEGDPMQFMGAPLFHYKNHNAAYQAILLAWALGYLAKGGPSGLKAVLGIIVVGGLISIQSRAGIAFAGVLVLFFAVLNASLLRRQIVSKPWLSTAAALLALGLLAIPFLFGGGQKALTRFAEVRPSINLLLHGDAYREKLHGVALGMFRDRPIWGWGAGSHVFLYTAYESSVPGMAEQRYNFRYNRLVRHSDGDWWEFLAEYGLLGTACFALIWLPHLWLWWKRRKSADPLALMVGCGVLLILYQGMFDTAFRNLGVNLLLASSTVLTSIMLRSGTPQGETPKEDAQQDKQKKPRRSRSHSAPNSGRPRSRRR